VLAKTFTLDAIKKAIDPETEFICVEGDLVAICETEEPCKLKAVFKKAGERYVKVDLPAMLELIVSKLAPHIDVKRFLTELITLHSSAEEVLELNERLEKGDVKISEEKRCYSLMVGGKRGRPYEFNLVS